VTKLVGVCLLLLSGGLALELRQPPDDASNVRLVAVGPGWARSSVNAVIFRQHSVATFGDTQVVAYYDASGRMILARRSLGETQWEKSTTQYRGNVRDAHNAISLAFDGHGVLHVAWDHHGQPLNYVRAVAPASLQLTGRQPMTGRRENRVTYPQFVNLPNGDLLLAYRDGQSGAGDVLLNRFELDRGRWRAVNHPLISGEGERNAYLNGFVVDRRGRWHVSWCWRETADVATNHDLAYAVSSDQGKTWTTSTGRRYRLPIVAATAEIIWTIPQSRELINQTTMTVDGANRPVVATYFREAGEEVPQYRIVWHDGARWRASQVGRRVRPFTLGGGGTKRTPISRPLITADEQGAIYVVFRDEERGGGISVAVSRDPARTSWDVSQLWGPPVGRWEPTHDPNVWRTRGELHLFHQRVGQGDGETLEEMAPQMVSILEWRPRGGH
jgi:hypothetical protein